MAGDWIKFEKATLDKPEVFEMAGVLEIDPDAVVGKLMRVWNWFDDQSRDGYAPVTLAAQLNRITGVTGFVDAMKQVGWMTIEGGRLSIPNFDRHNGQTSKQRALSAKRMSKKRSNSYDGGVTSSVTKAQPEKRREEKSIIPPNPQGGFDLDNSEDSKKPKRPKRITPAQKRISKIAANTPTMDRIGSWFGRRESTLWTVAEAEALAAISPTPAELDGMEALYTAEPLPEGTFIRNSLQTLLNNWPGELDKARGFARKQRGAA